MSDVVERAALALLAYEDWRVTDGKRKPPHERKGEPTPGYRGETADDVVQAYTDDVAEQCRILGAANARAREIREGVVA